MSNSLLVVFDKASSHVRVKHTDGQKYYRGFLTVNGSPWQSIRRFRTASFAKFYSMAVCNRYYRLKAAQERQETQNENSN